MGTVGGNWTRSSHQGLSTPQSPVQHVGWHPAAPAGEKDSMAVVASVKQRVHRKEKRETQQLGHSSSTCPSPETCRVEAVGTSFEETGWAPLSSPICCIGHSSIASSLLGNPCWARGQEHAPHHPSRGRVCWKLSLESSRQRQSSWDSLLPSANAHWQRNYKRARVPPSQGREQEKHMVKLISPETEIS